MKNLRAIIAAAFFLTWAPGLFAALPQVPFSIRIGFDLPAQTIQFDDLDFRDENNQPVVRVETRRRFEDVFNRNLNRLLIENLTPLRRAWLEMLGSQNDPFADFLGRVMEPLQRWVATVGNGGPRLGVFIRWASIPFAQKLNHENQTTVNDFRSLTSLLISTTCLLR